MRVAILIGAGGVILALAGCGGEGPDTRKAQPRVRLVVTAPRDGTTVHRGTVDVRGRVVPPAAQVRVLGRPALVTGGGFTVVVPIEPGADVVDVMATAPGRRPALTAVRVRREQRVVVPELAEVDVDELEATLEAVGLGVQVTSTGGFLDRFIPRAVAVCEQDPSAGSRVRRGTTVRVLVARSC